jgi:hypothetical protein
MGKEKGNVLNYLTLARKRARQLRRALGGLLEIVPNVDDLWPGLVDDADAIEHQVQRAIDAIEAVLQREVAGRSRLIK